MAQSAVNQGQNFDQIAYVISISGSKLNGLLAPDIAPENKVQIGDFVKMKSARSMAFGLVSALSIEEPSWPPDQADKGLIEIDLIGEAMDYNPEGRFSFQRGVSVYPGLGSPVMPATLKDLAQIFARPQESYVRIGSIRQNSTLPAFVNVDNLVGKHFAILGNTGTGKSCAVTILLHSLLRSHPNAHMIVLDPHDEYASAFQGLAEVITPKELELPYWLLNFEESVGAFCSRDENERAVEASILKEAMGVVRKQARGKTSLDIPITVDAPLPYRLEALSNHIRSAMGKLNRPEGAKPYLRLLSRMEDLRMDRRYRFMFSPLLAKDILSRVLGKILRFPVQGKPLTIFCLGGLPSEIVDVVVSLLSRMLFDFAYYTPEADRVPLLMICEEAHRYVPRTETGGFAPTSRAIARIAKEGRKYGVCLGLITQRPSEISEVVLSQCNTLFSLRLSNDRDQTFVKHALPENADALINALPALRTQEAIVVGEGVNVPTIFKFSNLPQELKPTSSLYRVSQKWVEDDTSGDLVDTVIKNWRRQ